MAKSKTLPAKIKKKVPTPLTILDFGEAKSKFLADVSQKIADTDFATLRVGATWWINNNILRQMDYFRERLLRRDNYWDDNQLKEAFEMLIEITNMLNEKIRYQPQIGDFCRIIGVTQQTFNDWTFQNNERGEQARYIQDYFKSMLVQGMAVGEINPVAGSFIGKTTLGMKEEPSASVNINVLGADLSVEDILANYEKNRKS